MNLPSDTGASQAPQAEGALRPFLRAIRAHKLLLALVLLATIAGAVAWLAVRVPVYEATAQMLVTPVPVDDPTFRGLRVFRESGDPTRDVETAAALIETVATASNAARSLGGEWTFDDVLDDVEVEPQGQSSVLAVTGVADDPQLAARLANEFARAALDERNELLQEQADAEIPRLRALQEALPAGTAEGAAIAAQLAALGSIGSEGDPTLSLVEEARPPDAATGVSPLLTILLAALAGFSLGAGAAMLRELLERRLRDEEEAIELYGLPILSRVPVLKRRELAAATGRGWLMPPRIREAFRTLIAQLRRQDRTPVVMIASASTGDGKTTSAINLGATLAAAGERVILLDLDLRKPDVARSLEMQSSQGLPRLLSRQGSLQDLLISVPALPTLSILPHSEAVEAEFVEPINRRLPELLAQARELAEWVVLDTAPLGEVADALRILSHVDEIVIVTRPGNTKRRDFEVMRDLLERAPGGRPSGFVLITAREARSRSDYYGSAMEQRPMRIPQ